MRQTLYVTSNSDELSHEFRMLKDESRELSIDWSNLIGARASSIAESCFDTNNSSLGISGATVDGNVTSVLVSAPSIGKWYLTNSITMQNGEIVKRKWYVTVTDPQSNAWDYP